MITSIPDLIIIGGVALLVFGPKRLPELAKSLGVGIRDFKRAMDGIEDAPTTKIAPPAQEILPPTETAKT